MKELQNLLKLEEIDEKKVATTLKTNNMSVQESMKSVKKNLKFYKNYFLKK